MFWEARVGLSGGLSPLVEAIESDFKGRLPGYHKSRREGLSTLAGIVLETRSANLMELAASLPRPIGSKDHRYQDPPKLIPGPALFPGSDTICCISTRHQWFAFARLSVSHLTGSCPAFSATLTTPALDQRSLRWFEARA